MNKRIASVIFGVLFAIIAFGAVLVLTHVRPAEPAPVAPITAQAIAEQHVVRVADHNLTWDEGHQGTDYRSDACRTYHLYGYEDRLSDANDQRHEKDADYCGLGITVVAKEPSDKPTAIVTPPTKTPLPEIPDDPIITLEPPIICHDEDCNEPQCGIGGVPECPEPTDEPTKPPKPTDPPEDKPTKTPDPEPWTPEPKEQCNNGGGNGTEGCDSSDNGNDDGDGADGNPNGNPTNDDPHDNGNDKPKNKPHSSFIFLLSIPAVGEWMRRKLTMK